MAKTSRSKTKLAPRGSVCVGVLIGLTLAGLFLKDGILLTLGLSAATLMLACFIIGKMNTSRLGAQIKLPTTLHANKDYFPYITLTNDRTFIDAFSAKLTLALPHGTLVATQTPWIAARCASSATIPLNIPMRASTLQHPYKITSYFPLSLFHFTTHRTLSHPLTVYPRPIVPKELTDHGSLGHTPIPMQMSLLTDQGEPRGIRPWQPGDPAKSIHWPASIRSFAHGHGIRVRENDPPGQLPEHTTLILHSFSADRQMMREDTFERAISLVVGTINHLRNLNIRITLLTDVTAWHPHSIHNATQYYDVLAILAQAKRPIGTEKHELQHTINQLPKNQPAIIISDMVLTTWTPHITMKPHHLPIDISQVRYPIKQTLSAKKALDKVK